MRDLTRQQALWLVGTIESFAEGPEPCAGRGQRQVANALERRGLLAVCDPRDNGEDGVPEVAITEAGILYLYEQRDDTFLFSERDRRKLLRVMGEDDRTAHLVAAVGTLTDDHSPGVRS